MEVCTMEVCINEDCLFALMISRFKPKCVLSKNLLEFGCSDLLHVIRIPNIRDILKIISFFIFDGIAGFFR